jgi:D-serine deaminase-like pyridoxal phosphate-dependent protein
MIGMDKYELPTPCLVVDLDRLDGNIRAMQAFVSARGKQLRPHAKTHKCSRLARRQLEAGAVGVSVAKLAEAEVMLAAGIGSVLITSPVTAPSRIEHLAHLAIHAPNLMTVVDEAGTASALAASARRLGTRIKVLVDVDAGLGRTGVAPDRAETLADLVCRSPGLELVGVQAYAGHVQHIRGFEARHAASLKTMRPAAELVRAWRARGRPCSVFTGAGTGSHDADCEIPELTDLQTGSYVFLDAEYLRIGSRGSPDRLAGFETALTLLTTVVSANQPGWVTVDAGFKALYPGTEPPRVLGGEAGGLTYEWFGDEHGRIRCPDPSRRPVLGAVLELITAHCDPTVNLHDTLFVTQQDRVVDIWPVDARGCGT